MVDIRAADEEGHTSVVTRKQQSFSNYKRREDHTSMGN